MGVSKLTRDGYRARTELGAQTVSVVLFGYEEAAVSQALVTDSIFWIAPDYLGLNWRIASIEYVRDNPGGSGATVKINKLLRNADTATLLATIDVSSGGVGSQNLGTVDLSGLSDTQLTLTPGDKLAFDTAGTIDGLRGFGATIVVVPEKATWFRFEPEVT